MNGEVYFENRTWNEYENGFGDLAGSFWLGLKKVKFTISRLIKEEFKFNLIILIQQYNYSL